MTSNGSPSSSRRMAVAVLNRFERDRSFPSILEHGSFGHHLSNRERAFAHLLTMGVLQNRTLLDWVLGPICNHPLTKLPVGILNTLRLGAFELLRLPDKPAPIIVNEYVSLARLEGHKGTASLVNAVLRKVARVRHKVAEPDPEVGFVEWLSIRCSHPRWLVERWTREFGEEDTVRLCETNNEPPAVCLRINPLKAGKHQVLQELEQIGMPFKESPYTENCLILNLANASDKSPRLGQLPGLAKGWYTVQDEAAQLVGLSTQLLEGHTVVDACSAPGGKTTHMASLMRNKGKVIAVDRNAGRLRTVHRNCDRLGVSIAEFHCGDFRDLARDFSSVADICLVDVPCSGTGVLRRKPDIRWQIGPQDIAELSSVQYQLLASAANVVRPGGSLVYSTCSMEREENHGVIELFLQRYANYRLAPAGMPPSTVTDEGYFWCLPHRHNTDGAFAARLTRKL